MAERPVTITPTSGPLAGQTIQATINDPSGNPFMAQQQGGGAMVPYQGGANYSVTLPSGQVLSGLTEQQAMALRNEATLLQQQQPRNIDLRQGAGNTWSTLGTFAEAGLTISEWFQGREAKRLLERAYEARHDALEAEKKILAAFAADGTVDGLALKAALDEYTRAVRRVNDYQDDIALAAANQAYVRAGGGAIKTVERLQQGGGGGLFGSGGGGLNTGTAMLAGAAGGFLLSELFDDRDRYYYRGRDPRDEDRR